MFKKGQSWTVEQTLKIFTSKYKNKIIQSILKEPDVVDILENDTREDIERKTLNVFKNRVLESYKKNEEADDIKTVIKAELNKRMYKTWEEQVAENLKQTLKENGQWDEFRRKTGWNTKFSPDNIVYVEYYDEAYFDKSKKGDPNRERYAIYKYVGPKGEIVYKSGDKISKKNGEPIPKKNNVAREYNDEGNHNPYANEEYNLVEI